MYSHVQPLKRECHPHGTGLSEGELQLLASLIAEPVLDEDGDSCTYFSSIDAAAAERPQVQELVAKATVSTSVLHDVLVEDLELLKYNQVDEVPALKQSTLKKRQRASDIWGGRRAWLTGPDAGTRSHHRAEVEWDKRWYSQFTFMIDATSFEDGALSKGSSKENVYTLENKQWGPTHVTGPQTVTATTRVMVYCIIHPFGGLICGPDIVFTGSKIPHTTHGTHGDERKEQIQAKNNALPSWCAPTLH